MMNKKKAYISYGINLILVLALFFFLRTLIVTGVLNRYQADLITLVCINVTMAVSLNLVTGLLGQLVLGHAGFMLVGAYAAALFTKNSSLPVQVS